MSGEEDQTESRPRLVELTMAYLKKKGFEVTCENVAMDGQSGISRHFDLLVMQKNRNEQGVWIRDWNRTIGVNVIINLDTASEDAGLTNPIMVGEKFSYHAKSYANRRRIELLTKQKIESFR